MYVQFQTVIFIQKVAVCASPSDEEVCVAVVSATLRMEVVPTHEYGLQSVPVRPRNLCRHGYAQQLTVSPSHRTGKNKLVFIAQVALTYKPQHATLRAIMAATTSRCARTCPTTPLAG